MNTYSQFDSPLGKIILSANERVLNGLWFEGQKHFPKSVGIRGDSPILTLAKKWLADYFAGNSPDVTFPLEPAGTEFQRSVWEILRGIPYGCTITYGEIAHRLAENRGIPRMSAQAVGNAVGRNPISIIIPCHRVIGADGSLTGYAGGLHRKKLLLDLEKGIR